MFGEMANGWNFSANHNDENHDGAWRGLLSVFPFLYPLSHGVDGDILFFCLSVSSWWYYLFSFQEFPHEGDTCYLAHCYPYSYTDLELYLRTIMENRKTAQYFHKEVNNACN